jgi:hypothetical protein
MERQMITTKRVFALAALIVATGVGTVEMSRSTAQAAEATTMSRIEAYSAARVDTAFDLVAAMPISAPFMVPMAQKGDLLVPPGCTGMSADAQGECMDVAYEMDSVPSAVIETREGTTSTLLKLDPMTLAVVTDQTLQQSE